MSKKWDNFYMDDQTGGLQAYDEYKRMYLHFSIANEIIKDRSISDKVWRLRVV